MLNLAYQPPEGIHFFHFGSVTGAGGSGSTEGQTFLPCEKMDKLTRFHFLTRICGRFAQIFDYGTGKEEHRLVLVIVFCFYRRPHPGNRHPFFIPDPHPSFRLYFLCQGDGYHVMFEENVNACNKEIRSLQLRLNGMALLRLILFVGFAWTIYSLIRQFSVLVVSLSVLLAG